MFSIDTFPCLQVSLMNRYRKEYVKPQLSHYAVKVYGNVEGMIQLTRDRRAIHIAVRTTKQRRREGFQQLQEMEDIAFKQVLERSRGSTVSVCCLSPVDLNNSGNLEDNVRYYIEKSVQEAINHQRPLVNPATLRPESFESVIGFLDTEDAGKKPL